MEKQAGTMAEAAFESIGQWIEGSMTIFTTNISTMLEQLRQGTTIILKDGDSYEGAITTIENLSFKRRYLEGNKSEYILDNDSRRKCLRVLTRLDHQMRGVHDVSK